MQLVLFIDKACEYFCPKCKQLRLAPGGPPKMCGNCGNESGLVVGKIGELNKDELVKHA